MEEIFERFPGLGKRILQQLDSRNVAESRKVNERWKRFIDQDKTIWIRRIQKHIGYANVSPDWKMVMFKTSTDTVMELATAVGQFYKSKPIRMDNKWSPLHIIAERGNMRLFQLIIGKTQDINPRNDNGVTPLLLAAQEGHLQISKLIVENVEEKNLARDSDGVTPMSFLGFISCTFPMMS